jgi:membrane protease YdiL (CAAX protease family)
MTEEIILPEPEEEIAEVPELGKQEARRRFSRVGFALLAMVALQQGGGLALILLINSVPALAGIDWLPIVANFLPLYLLALPVYLWIMRGQTPMPPVGEKRRVSGGLIAQSAFACYAVMLLCNLIVGLGLYSLIGLLKGGEVSNPLTSMVTQGSPLAVLPFVVLGAPLLEEYVFRGVLLRHLGAFGAKPYMLFSALVFAMFHANLAQIPYAFVMGLVLAGMTYYTGTIKYAVVTHMAVNVMGGGLPGVLLKLGETGTMLVGLAAIVFAAAGVVCAVLLLNRRKRLVFAPGSVRLPKGAAVGNAGVIAFIAVMVGLTVYVLTV